MRILNIFKISCILIALSFFTLAVQPVQAKSFTYPQFNVDVNINKDSTVDIQETLTYKFDGEFRGVIAEILLNNNRCSGSSSSILTCGGFERIALLGVYDEDGRKLDPSEYELYIEEDEDTEERFFTIKWTVWPNGKTFTRTDPTFTWSFKYRVYGSLGVIQGNPIFYWNAIAGTRGGSVDNAEINISLPNGVIPKTSALKVYEYRPQTSVSGNDIQLQLQNLSSSGDVTVSYEFDRDDIQIPAKLVLDQQLPYSGTKVKLDGVDLGDIEGRLNNFPPGRHSVELYFGGYESQTVQVDADPGETITLTVNLKPRPETAFILFLNQLLNLVGVALLPIGVFLIHRHWSTHGKDIDKAKTIVPLFSPPKGVRPYLLGALKDEQVDPQDITGTIIDLAYRGYIKIKELPKGLFEGIQNYELTKLEGKQGDPGLNAIEETVMNMLFGISDTVETKELGASFASQYPTLTQKVYTEMVELKYFNKSPQTVRATYAGIGLLVMLLGAALFFVMGIGAIGFIGIPGPVLLGVAVLILGVILIIISKAMPAKTSLGSKTLAEIMGFRMYLYHAERYRVQNLAPDEFEKYLSYAIVFGIEKQWADTFKDIYKQKPDWYDGNATVWDAYWLSNFGRSFATSMNTSVYTPSGSSASGSGWSGGGGSFGGFSGGGGGGGGRGAF